jgi:hypothetical protein
MTQKVYVIRPPELDNRKHPTRPPDPTESIDFSPAPQAAKPDPGKDRVCPQDSGLTRAPTPRDRWIRVLMAYILGPAALMIRPAGQRRIYWAILGALSMVAGAYLVLGRATFNSMIGTTDSGVFIWIALVTFVFLVAATAWARAVAVSGRDHPPLASISPGKLRHPLTVGALSLALPGLGLLMRGKTRRAAAVLWTIGPLLAALVILANGSLLWNRSQWSVPAGPSGLALEIVFVVAAVFALVTLLIWVVQALDGARRFCTTQRSLVRADSISLALLVTVIAFVSTVRPVPFAESLSLVSGGLHQSGFRLIPLVLSESAARLDPASPVHLADAAVLNDELGMKDAARAKKIIIDRRMMDYVNLARDHNRPDRLTLAFSYAARRSFGLTGQDNGGETMTRIRELIHAQQVSLE